MAQIARSIPDWTYSEEYYASIVAPEYFEIRTDPVKGKGLFATRAFQEGDVVLEEKALCCAQNLDDFLAAAIPVCATCLRSVESPVEIVKRVAGEMHAQALRMAIGAAGDDTIKYPCREATSGCSVVYCSRSCESSGWHNFHAVQCSGVVSDKAKAALQKFVHHGWVQGGIDLSDTHFVALRFVAFVVARMRGGLPVEAAWGPVGQLIRAPITSFNFTYLVMDEFEADAGVHDPKESPHQKLHREWVHFTKYKGRPAEDPVVQYANQGLSKAAMLSEGLNLIHEIFDMSAEERTFFETQRWSEMLGMVLLNGQERSPNSPFFELRSGKHRSALSPFIKRCRAAGIKTRLFDTSTRGQGIYSVGACFNHSCRPNIQVTYNDRNDETLVVVALGTIQAGDELCISYIDEHAAVQVRQQQLYEHYLFTCSCAKCVAELEGLEERA